MSTRRRYRRRSRVRKLRDYATAFALLVAVAFAAAWLEQRATEQLTGHFVVVDGDSLRIEGRDLRLYGIDAPELDQTCQRGGEAWQCGRAARGHLAGLVDAAARCEGLETDRYDRLLVQCFSGTQLINRQMVADGYAVAFGQHEADERAARQKGLGLWASDFDRPADWRAERLGGLAETSHTGGLRQAVRNLLAPISAMIRAWQGGETHP